MKINYMVITYDKKGNRTGNPYFDTLENAVAYRDMYIRLYKIETFALCPTVWKWSNRSHSFERLAGF